MPDKKIIDLMDLIQSNLDGEFEWISSTAFLPPEGTPAASNHQVKAARMLGDALIALLNQSTVDPKPYKSIKVKVAGPARVATREELEVFAEARINADLGDLGHQLQEWNKKAERILEEVGANGDRLHRVQERLDAMPGRSILASTAVKIENNIDRRNTWTAQKLAGDIKGKLDEIFGQASPVSHRSSTMSGKGVFWYNASSDTVCEGAARPAGAGWARLVPAPESVESAPHRTVEDVQKFANTAPLFGAATDSEKVQAESAEAGFTIPSSVEDRKARTISEAETIRKGQDRETWNKGYAAGRRSGLDAEPRSNTGALPVHLDYWVPEDSAKHIAEDYAKYRGDLAGIINMGLRSPMSVNDMDRLLDLIFDNYDSFIAVLGRYGESMEHLAKSAMQREAASGGLRKQLGLGK